MLKTMPDIYATLFDRIIAGVYRADTRLKEELLAAEFKVSRTPIREALRMLAQDGLVEMLPRRSAVVLGFTVDDVEEIYDIRKSLEIQALRNSVQNLSIHKLKELRSRLIEASTSSDYRAHQAVDADLHNSFIEASGKKRLIRILQQLFRLIQQFRDMGFRDPSVQAVALEEHMKLVDALAVRDLAEAERILASHIEMSKKNAISLIVRGEFAQAVT
jgi:DNA-binding GntR family transcriptional regulator